MITLISIIGGNTLKKISYIIGLLAAVTTILTFFGINLNAQQSNKTNIDENNKSIASYSSGINVTVTTSVSSTTNSSSGVANAEKGAATSHTGPISAAAAVASFENGASTSYTDKNGNQHKAKVNFDNK